MPGAKWGVNSFLGWFESIWIASAADGSLGEAGHTPGTDMPALCPYWFRRSAIVRSMIRFVYHAASVW